MKKVSCDLDRLRENTEPQKYETGLDAGYHKINRRKSVSHLSFKPGSKVIKLFFMLSSTETKIFPAHKC